MMLDVLTAGPMLTIQDSGRPGLRRFGVSTAGPMDAPSLALANALCANTSGVAALEFAGPGGSFRAKQALRFAVTGGPCDIRIDGHRVLAGQSHRLNEGEVLRVGVPDGAVWGYLAFSGGIATPPILGARTTHLRSGIGGMLGRAVRAGDSLPLGPDTAASPCMRPPINYTNQTTGSDPIRLVAGPQHDHFAPDILTRLTNETFLVTPQRDRMAMVLGGVELPCARGHDIVSDATVPGSIQVPGSGTPLVLMAESQTTGGYPKIATVITADLPRLAQMPTGTSFRFALVSRDAAEDLWLARQKQLRALLAGLIAKPEDLMQSDYLLSCDLVGGIFSPEDIVRSGPSQDSPN